MLIRNERHADELAEIRYIEEKSRFRGIYSVILC